MTQSENFYEKTITITNLSSKNITPRPGGKMFDPFTVYMVEGNDRIVYETTDLEWYSQRRVGENINLRYSVESKVGAGNKVYSHYKVQLPPKQRARGNQVDIDLIIEGMTKIYHRIEEVEKNLLARFDVRELNPHPVEVPVIQMEEEEEANRELDALYNQGGEGPVLPIQETEDAPKTKKDLPF